MHTTFRRLVSVFAALSWAGVLLHFVISGRIHQYLAPVFRQYALIGGLGLLVLAAFVLLTFRRPSDCGHDHAPGEAHDHETSDLSPLVILLLMVAPALFAASVTKDSFSLRALTHKGAFDLAARPLVATRMGAVPTREEIIATRPRTPEGVTRIELLELFSAAMDAEYAANLEGIEVAVEGRVLIGKDQGGHPVLYRLLLTCCAADGRPLPLRLRWAGPQPPLEENAWFEITGTVSFEKTAPGVRTPFVMVRTMKSKEAPVEESLLRY
ncbi:TIGR03943 family protein [bacterium]|nr:TIGR03943 family protein [bacterium]